MYEKPGEIRSGPVKIPGTDYRPEMPKLDEIEKVLRQAKKIEHPIKQGFYLFDHIAREQWLSGGTKRTAQLVANHVFVQNNAAMLAVPVEERENFEHKLIEFTENGWELTKLKNASLSMSFHTRDAFSVSDKFLA
ncbi:hypothetical protein lacNasYZ03_16370 [Lactobacillus nasalidis]|uniref:Uncharacterized protein n=1 Tax=Lactobacillus nasalidis TaxID=2797258 RepID=A0ABQ3W9C6_9LACO|nr:hypothetical protein [Lactobacillus nasalidis]GHV97197.1 hypothetical protein lacNasYZ01_03790 [Lactobacillus nasalidis]GHV99350.1 hypothetical protein lacNasYZ02_07800 [Lactobacillus nasalidis]GHW01950.1 hypothetical protein lacNasYZ03_16370 [Lactobacillus nasalidis]